MGDGIGAASGPDEVGASIDTGRTEATNGPGEVGASTGTEGIEAAKGPGKVDASIVVEGINAGNGPGDAMHNGAPDITIFRDYLNSKKLQREVERESRRIERYLAEMQRCVTQIG